MNNTNKVPRSHKLLCCYTLLALISVASGELQHAHHRFRTASFVPRKGRIINHDEKRLSASPRRQQRSSRIPSLLSASDVLLNLRCGGADDESSNVDDDGGDEEIIAESNNDGDGSSDQQPLVDISVVEVESSEDPISTNTNHAIEVDDGGDTDTEVDLAPSEGDSEADTSRADDVDTIIGDKNDDSDSDIETSSEEDALSDDVDSDSDSDQEEAGMENVVKITSDTTTEEIIASASNRRAEGKTLHDSGDLADAAQAFNEAASMLDEVITIASSAESSGGGDMDDIAVERATCRLHEALCLLKDGRPGDCIEACSDVLEDGVTVIPSEEDDNHKDVDTDIDAEDGTNEEKKQQVVTIIPPISDASSIVLPPQIRARAHHRRAKARLALGDLDGALEDARSAAFMGDRNAVQFYGRLMREGSGAAAGDALSPFGGLGSNSSPFGSSDGSSGSNPFLDGVLKGMSGDNGNPLMPSGAGSSDFSSSLLSSLLTGSGPGDGGGSSNPFGFMGDLLAPPPPSDGKKRRRGSKSKKGGGNGGVDSLAKSVLTSMLKRIEDESTQEQICNYLQRTNTQQIMTFASMAGVPLKESSATKLVSFANGVTPKTISKSINRVKRGISIVKVVRKILKVIDKYKAFIILGVLCYWVRSAIMEPYPVSSKKQAKKMLVQKAALSLLIMPAKASPSSGQSRSSLLGNLCGSMVKKVLYMSGGCDDENINIDDGASTTMGIEEELERLQNQLSLIEAIEERNKAQLDSFVDEEDQWQSLEEDERDFLRSKDIIIQKMEVLAEQLVMLFMGQKMRNG